MKKKLSINFFFSILLGVGVLLSGFLFLPSQVLAYGTDFFPAYATSSSNGSDCGVGNNLPLAFDANNATSWATCNAISFGGYAGVVSGHAGGSGGNSQSVVVDLGVGVAKGLGQLGIVPFKNVSGMASGDFYVYGSNDNLNATSSYIFIASSSVNTAGTDGVEQDFNFNSATTYRWYRIDFTSNGRGAYPGDGYIQIYEIIGKECTSECGGGGGGGSSSSTIRFLTDNISSSSPPNSWHIEYTPSTTSTDLILVHWNTITAWEQGNFVDEFPATTRNASSTYDIWVMRQNNTMFASTTYKGYVEAINIFSGQVSSSSIIYFTFGSSTDNGLQNFNVLNTFSANTIDCSGYTISLFSSTTLPGIGCVIQKTFTDIWNWLITPPTFAVSAWESSLDNFQNVLPFSIIYGTKLHLENNATSTNPTLTIGMFDIQGNLVSSTIPTLESFMTTAHCNASCALAQKNTLFDIEKMFIWLSAGITAIFIIF